ncbi:MAG: type VI secretion system contractile sheath large subunit [Polyangiaceae bacterium]|nr:type VI secretion system contractile sheath large subunit [Polyangiaceae bacterium]
MPISESAKKIQEDLLESLGQASDSIFEADDKALALVGTVDHNGETLVRFRDRDQSVGDKTRFMNALAALLVNYDVEKLDNFSAVLAAVNELSADIDKVVRDYMDVIMHSDGVQKIESNWRSLSDLAQSVNQEDVIIDYLDARMTDLDNDFVDHGADIFGSALFRKVYIEEYDRYGGKPFSAMIGLYGFTCEDKDIRWLNVMGKIANAAHCPFVSSVTPEFFPPAKTMEDVANIADLDAVLSHPRYSKWNELREQDWAAYIGLTLPRYILRQPWGRKEDERGNTIGYVETVAPEKSGDADDFLWGSSAILFAKNMIRSYENSGWAQHLRGPKGGGIVEGLTVYSYMKNGREELKPPVEIAIPDYRELQFSRNGFISLVHKKGEGVATFFGAQSIKKPKFFVEDLATKNSHLVTNMAYTFSITRIAHYAKRMMREYIGSTADGPYVQRVLADWLNSYVTIVTNPDDLTLLYYPFKATSVTVEPKPGPFGWYKAVISVLPHVQFEGMDVELRLEAALGGK